MSSPDLHDRLRAGRPVASHELRRRVRALGAPPPQRGRLALSRPAVALAAAGVAAAALGVLGYGVAGPGPAVPRAQAPAVESAKRLPGPAAAKSAAFAAPAPAAPKRTTAPPRGTLERMGVAALWLAIAGLPLAAVALVARYVRRRRDARLFEER